MLVVMLDRREVRLTLIEPRAAEHFFIDAIVDRWVVHVKASLAGMRAILVRKNVGYGDLANQRDLPGARVYLPSLRLCMRVVLKEVGGGVALVVASLVALLGRLHLSILDLDVSGRHFSKATSSLFGVGRSLVFADDAHFSLKSLT